MQAQGIEQVDECELVALCQRVDRRESQDRGRYQGGQAQGRRRLIGQAKKKNPNVNPGRFRELVIELVGKK